MFISPDKLGNYLYMTHTSGVDQHAQILLWKSHVFVHSTATSVLITKSSQNWSFQVDIFFCVFYAYGTS